jgi:putative serine/threonine protein kinase
MQRQISKPKRDDETVIVELRELSEAEHGAILCYPGTDFASFPDRISQLKALGVEHLILEGDSKVGKYGIVGRGCVSTVVKAKMKAEKSVVALKIRRADANRPDMSHDFQLQKYANSFGVGPKAIDFSRDFFAMEFIDSTKLGKWFQFLKTRSSKKFMRSLIRNTLEQCLELDLRGLDHGELSNPTKHVLIRNGVTPAKTTIIDFESASRQRKVSNLTSVAQFFILGGWQSEKVRKILGLGEGKEFVKARSELLSKLRSYKNEPSRDSFEDLLSRMNC